MNTLIECPARRAVANILREARLNWRLSRLKDTLEGLEPIVRMIDVGGDLIPSLGERNKSATGARHWARGCIRLAASCAYLLGRGDTLNELLDMAQRQWGDDATLLQLAARAAMDDRRVEESIALIRRACALAPRRPRLLELLSRLEAQAGHMDEAIAAVRVAARLRPRRASLRIELAELALASGDCSLGLTALGALIDPPCLLHARLLAGCGRLSEAAEIYDRLIDARYSAPTIQSISPNQSRSIALQSFNRGVRADQDLLDASVERIEVLARMGDRAALIELADAELIDPFRSKTVLIRLADAMLNMGDAMRCIQLASRCRQGLEQPYALALISVAASLLGRPLLAERCRQRLGVRDQSLLARAWRRGLMAQIIAAQMSCEGAGKDPTQSVLEPLLQQALHALTERAVQSPDYADLHFHRGNCLAALGREDEARDAAEVALSINPHYADAQRLAGNLKIAA